MDQIYETSFPPLLWMPLENVAVIYEIPETNKQGPIYIFFCLPEISGIRHRGFAWNRDKPVVVVVIMAEPTPQEGPK